MRGDETFAAPADGTTHRLATESSCSGVASGSPVPRRRAFASAIHGLGSLRAACAFALRASLAGKTGSRGTGDPELAALEGSASLAKRQPGRLR